MVCVRDWERWEEASASFLILLSLWLVVLTVYHLIAASFVFPLKFSLIVSTLQLLCLFINAEIAYISNCVQTGYHLLVQQEWTNCLVLTPLPSLTRHIPFSSSSSYFSVLAMTSYLSSLPFFTPQWCNLPAGPHPCSLTCFFFLYIISSF